MRILILAFTAMIGASPLSACNGFDGPTDHPAGEQTDGARWSAGDQAFWVEEVAAGLENFPSSMAWLPDGDILMAERQGGLRVMRDGVLNPKPVAGTPVTFQLGLNGIKDILLDPGFEANRTIFLCVSEGTYERNHAAVYRARYGPQGLEDVQRIFRSKDELIGSGSGSSRMILLDDGTLLVGIPENDSYKARAQRLDSHIGKLVRIHRDGSVPADNPFVNTPGALPEIYSYGHRVTLGLFQDPDSGQVLVAESGPAGGDEVNLLKAGANYGWARASWGFDYTGALAAPLQSAPGIEDPLLVWTPAVTPAGLIRYLSDAFPLWHGDYFVGHLTARQVERIRIEANRVVLQERLLADLGERIRDLKVGPDGLIYILTDHQKARLLRLQPGTPAAEDQHRVAQKLDEEVDLEGNIEAPDIGPGDPFRGRKAFLEHCSACHRVGNATAGGSIGPDLGGVFGRNAGSLEGYRYSQAMADSPQVWNARTLNLFMADPQRYLPGTKMSSPPVPELEIRRNIVGFLQQPTEK